MEATKRAEVLGGGSSLRMAGDLLWFGAASLAVGLVVAIGTAAIALLLAQPAFA